MGQTWLADLGPDTPLGHFTVDITFAPATQVSFEVTGGAIKGRRRTMDYTTTQLRDGLYVVRWTEPATTSPTSRTTPRGPAWPAPSSVASLSSSTGSGSASREPLVTAAVRTSS
ncbi:MoaF-related domain-containing protein [Streptomyces sp. NPDC001492]